MDPFTQGTLGAALPQSTCHRAQLGAAGAVGFLSGMAADLDILIRSASDPLMFLEYHRQFTHSFVFIPVGGVLVALVVHLLLKRWSKLDFAQTALFATLGFATHALLDAATSYGTMLLWPFSQERFAWRVISIVDPLFTLPVFLLVMAAWLKRKAGYARLGLAWAAFYLGLGVLQHQAALDMGKQLAARRGHEPARFEVKPSFGNLVVWKTLYENQNRFYVDAVRVGIAPKVFPGETIAKFNLARDLPWLDTGSQQARDIERFRRASDNYIALDPMHRNRIIDVRYSMLPNKVGGLWSIEVSPDASATDHVRFLTHRDNASESLEALRGMVLGTSP